MKVCYLTNLRVLISEATLVLKIATQKYPTKAILVPNLLILILHETLRFETF